MCPRDYSKHLIVFLSIPCAGLLKETRIIHGDIHQKDDMLSLWHFSRIKSQMTLANAQSAQPSHVGSLDERAVKFDKIGNQRPIQTDSERPTAIQ